MSAGGGGAMADIYGSTVAVLAAARIECDPSASAKEAVVAMLSPMKLAKVARFGLWGWEKVVLSPGIWRWSVRHCSGKLQGSTGVVWRSSNKNKVLATPGPKNSDKIAGKFGESKPVQIMEKEIKPRSSLGEQART
jgi:hypothetical protein